MMRSISFVLALLLTGCGFTVYDTHTVLRSSGRSIFEAELYPLTRENCASCHAEDQAPLFASASSDEAYRLSKDFVDFEISSNSTLAKKAGDKHCGLNCEGFSVIFATAIEKWAVAEASDSGDDQGGGGSGDDGSGGDGGGGDGSGGGGGDGSGGGGGDGSGGSGGGGGGGNNNGMTCADRPLKGTLSGLEAYKICLYPFLREKCASCHGNNIGPQFAVADVNTAYTRTKVRVNFGDIVRSSLHMKGIKAHGGCVTCVNANSPTILDGIDYWAASEN